MSYSEKLASRIRAALAHLPEVKEKRMFGGLAFMVDNKMCVTIGVDRIMCRIDPAFHDEAIKKDGCSTVVMRGRAYKGFVYVSEDSIQSEKDCNYWLTLAVEYNKIAKASKKRAK